MIGPEATVVVDLSDLLAFGKAVEDGLQNGSGPFQDMYLQWGVRWRSFVQERFDRYSRGGGNWPPLKWPRRHGRGDVSRASILRDTNTLFAALNPTFTGTAGQFQQQLPNGVEVGYGGPARHPNSDQLTVAGIAEVHNEGLGVNPQRQIIVPPDARTLELMRGDAQRALERAAS